MQESAHRATASFGRNYGYYDGWDEVVRYYVTEYETQRREIQAELSAEYPDLDRGESLSVGFTCMNPNSTSLAEIAGNGQTARGVWYSIAQETCGRAGGKISAVWRGEKVAADFVREAGGWKIWHPVIATDYINSAGTPHEARPLEYAPGEDPREIEFGHPTISMLTHDSRLHRADNCPPEPTPYEEWSEEIGGLDARPVTELSMHTPVNGIVEAAEDAEEAESSADAESTSSSGGETPVYGGTLTSYSPEFCSEYDPGAVDNRVQIGFIYDCLFNPDRYGTDRDEFCFTGSYVNSDYLTGQLAESREVADDYSSITVHLRQDVYFRDKTSVGMDEQYNVCGARQLVADDVKWSYDRLPGLDGAELVEPELTTRPTNLPMVDSIEVPDDFTIVFNFNTREEPAVSNFMSTFVHIGGPEWDDLTEDQQSGWHYATGTGPFIITDYVSDNSMTFTRNPNYFDTDADGNQLPYPDTVEMVHITESSTALVSFISGELDCIVTTGSLPDADEITTLKSSLDDDEYTIYNYPGGAADLTLKQGNNPVEALTGLEVREALRYAIDCESISTMYLGYEYDMDDINIVVGSVFNTDTIWCDPSSRDRDLIDSYTTYDPELARQMPADAGYPDGFEFTVQLFRAPDTDLYGMMQEELKDVGVTMNIEVGQIPTDMVSVGENADNPRSAGGSVGTSTTTGIANRILSDGSFNYAHQSADVCDEEPYAFLNATTPEEQIAAAKEPDEVYMAQHYVLFGSYLQSPCYYRSNVHGLNGENPSAGYYYGFM